MGTVTLGLASREDVNKRLLGAFDGKPQGQFISFESPELLFSILSNKRWKILEIMTGTGPMSISEVASRLCSNVNAAYSDIEALLNCGILQKNENGLIEFPFDAVHVDFILQAA